MFTDSLFDGAQVAGKIYWAIAQPSTYTTGGPPLKRGSTQKHQLMYYEGEPTSHHQVNGLLVSIHRAHMMLSYDHRISNCLSL